MKTGDDILVLALTAEAAAHVCLALQQHSKWAQRAGLAVPAELPEIERVLASRARRGHGEPPVEVPRPVHHDEVVTPRLLSYASTARVLGVSERTVKRLVRAGELTAVHILGAARVRDVDLDDYLEQLTAQSLTLSPKDVPAC